MRGAAPAFLIVMALSSCQSVDTKIADVNKNVYKYCVDLTAASVTAATLSKDKIAGQIDAAVSTYCNANVDDVPSALAVLAQTYLAVKHAGIAP